MNEAVRKFDVFDTVLSKEVWETKYRYKGGVNPPDNSITNTFQRVVSDLFPQGPIEQMRQVVGMMEDGVLVPAGRILSGAGTGNRVTMMNCYVMKKMDDSLEDIMQTLSETSLTMQQGGGTGTDFSTLRPYKALLKRTGSSSSGPMPFMDMWDAMCKTIMSAGHRRGAMMATMSIDHPNIIDFITAKHAKDRLRNFNVSVLVSDAFMQCLKEKKVWSLVHQSVHADWSPEECKERERTRPWTNGKVGYDVVYEWDRMPAEALWQMIMKSSYEYSEPGVIFIDRINGLNNLRHVEEIRCTNPCLAEGTLVSTPKGLRPVEDIKSGDLITTIKGAKVVTSVERHEQIPIHKVVLKSGQIIRATGAHIFHVWDPTKEIRQRTRSPTWAKQYAQWQADGQAWSADKRLDQLKCGDVVRLAPGQPPTNLIPSPFQGNQYDYGFLMGIIIGDGSYTETTAQIKIAVGSKEPEWIEVLRTVLRRMGETASLKLDENLNRGSSAVIQLSQAFTEIIRTTPLIKAKSYDKSIPLEFLNSNEDFLWGMFDGLISTDGVVNKHSLGGIVKLTTSSPNLARDFQRLSHLLGMNARTYRSARTGKEVTIAGNKVICKRDMYEVCLTGEHFHKINQSITLSHPRKSATLKAHAKTFSPQGDRYKTSIVSVEPDGVANVYDLYEKETDTWIAEGVVSRGCGEQPLPPYGACDLGHINLARLIVKPYTSTAVMDYSQLSIAVEYMVDMLDSVIDTTLYPLKEQEDEMKFKRRIGLGVTGLADALSMMGLRYGSSQAVSWTEMIMKRIAESAYMRSVVLAKEKGPAPAWDKETFNRTFLESLDHPTLTHSINQYGLRNCVLLTVAPTGTTSAFYGNVSSGCEPTFSHRYTRKVRQPDDTYKEFTEYSYTVRFFAHCRNLTLEAAYAIVKDDPGNFPTVDDLSVEDHVNMQAAVQKYVDASVSKTVNCPKDITFEKFQDVYLMAWNKGCKGCTTYRESDVRGSILVSASNLPPEKTTSPELPANHAAGPRSSAAALVVEQASKARPKALEGRTYKIKWPQLAAATYVTINHNDLGEPQEVFISSKNSQYTEWATALSVMISKLLKVTKDPIMVSSELKQINLSLNPAWSDGVFYGSIIAQIGAHLQEHAEEFSDMAEMAHFTHPEQFIINAIVEKNHSDEMATVIGHSAQCTACGSRNVSMKEGCATCNDCGQSNCN